jgi:hypothetical protein
MNSLIIWPFVMLNLRFQSHSFKIRSIRVFFTVNNSLPLVLFVLKYHLTHYH